MVEKSIIEKIEQYLAKLQEKGIHARQAVLFGSHAQNRADQWSDIDLIVIAPEFDGSREHNLVNRLWSATLGVDNRIDPIPCGAAEWETEDGSPILEIARSEGVVIMPASGGIS